jgi:uncharacterized protein (DUF4415 family)
MKRKPNPQKADRVNLAWTKETFARWKATGPGWQTRMAEELSRAV